MRFGKTTGAAFLFIDLMRQNGDFLVRRFAVEIRFPKCTGRDIKIIVVVGIHWN